MNTQIRTQQIVGMLWMTLCGVPSIFFLWFLLGVVCKSRPSVLSTLDFDLAVLFCLFALAGAVAGFPLFRGRQWARRFVTLIAVLTMIATAVWYFAFGSVTPFLGSFCVLAVISAVLLFLPRHEPVA